MSPTGPAWPWCSSPPPPPSARYIARDDIDWELLPILLAGSVVGAYVGARFIVRIPAHHLRLLFGLVLLAAAVRMIIA